MNAYLFPFVSGKMLARENATAPLRPENKTICICAQVIVLLDCEGLDFSSLSTETLKLLSPISTLSVKVALVSSVALDCDGESWLNRK
jgi:hypothetical protein